MTNYDVANEFCRNPNGYRDNKNMNVSYDRNIFYSYNTAIGKIVKDINGNNVVLISDNTFSSTTAKHLHYLKEACFNNGLLKMYILPQTINTGDFKPIRVVNELIARLEYFAKENLRQKYNREMFINSYAMLDKTRELKDYEEHREAIDNALQKHKETGEFILNYLRNRKIKK